MTANRNKDTDRLATARVLRLPSQAQIMELDTVPNWLGHSSAAAELDKFLILGATMRDLKDIRGAVPEHIAHLQKEHGLTIRKDGNMRRITG
jgi:hypothetical protein